MTNNNNNPLQQQHKDTTDASMRSTLLINFLRPLMLMIHAMVMVKVVGTQFKLLIERLPDLE